ncbi:hypothetical protein [Nitratifractor sp.]
MNRIAVWVAVLGLWIVYCVSSHAPDFAPQRTLSTPHSNTVHIPITKEH